MADVYGAFYEFSSLLETKVVTVDDYDEYCHYVAGLVGFGLSRLFHACRMENEAPESLSNSMGLFLQKANIIRDYLEDINEIPKPRMFWPRQIWNKYANKLETMAIGTLALCYNNVEVFRGVVKMRRGISNAGWQNRNSLYLQRTIFWQTCDIRLFYKLNLLQHGGLSFRERQEWKRDDTSQQQDKSHETALRHM